MDINFWERNCVYLCVCEVENCETESQTRTHASTHTCTHAHMQPLLTKQAPVCLPRHQAFCSFSFVSNFWFNPTKSRRITVCISCDWGSQGNWNSHTHTNRYTENHTACIHTHMKIHMVGYACVNRYFGRCAYHYALTHGADQINPLSNLPPALRKEWNRSRVLLCDTAGRCLLLKCWTHAYGWMCRNKNSSQVDMWRQGPSLILPQRHTHTHSVFK